MFRAHYEEKTEGIKTVNQNADMANQPGHSVHNRLTFSMIFSENKRNL